MAMVERSAQDAMRTFYCKFGNCGEVARGPNAFCPRHQTPESRHEVPAAGEAVEVVAEPEVQNHRCKFDGCDRAASSPVGRYSYCPMHRSKTVRDGLSRIDSQNGVVGGTVAPVPATLDSEMTHEGRLRKVLAAARALDKAELKMKAASEHLRRAKKAHRDALIEASAPHGVTHAE